MPGTPEALKYLLNFVGFMLTNSRNAFSSGQSLITTLVNMTKIKAEGRLFTGGTELAVWLSFVGKWLYFWEKMNVSQNDFQCLIF